MRDKCLDLANLQSMTLLPFLILFKPFETYLKYINAPVVNCNILYRYCNKIYQNKLNIQSTIAERLQASFMFYDECDISLTVIMRHTTLGSAFSCGMKTLNSDKTEQRLNTVPKLEGCRNSDLFSFTWRFNTTGLFYLHYKNFIHKKFPIFANIDESIIYSSLSFA